MDIDRKDPGCDEISFKLIKGPIDETSSQDSPGTQPCELFVRIAIRRLDFSQSTYRAARAYRQFVLSHVESFSTKLEPFTKNYGRVLLPHF